MKLSRKTKIRIRKAVEFARTLFLFLALILMALAVCSVDSESLVFPLVCFAIGFVFFGLSCALDNLLFETAYNNN